MTDNRTIELLQELRDLAVDVNPNEIIDHVSITSRGWTFDARWLVSWHTEFDRIADELEQEIAATLGSDRETELIRAIEDVLRHSTDTVWVGEVETLVDRMVALGVYGQDVYKGARPWEAKR